MCPYCVVLYIQNVLIMQCFICKVGVGAHLPHMKDLVLNHLPQVLVTNVIVGIRFVLACRVAAGNVQACRKDRLSS